VRSARHDDDEELCRRCRRELDHDELFDADELGLDPEDDDQRLYGQRRGFDECPD
jgi:hypothetical protein